MIAFQINQCTCTVDTFPKFQSEACVLVVNKEVYLFSRNTLICKSIWFCEKLTWNPAESPVFDVSKQLNVLHQAASCSNCYDIRDIAIHAYTNWNMRQPSAAHSIAWKHQKREIQLGSRTVQFGFKYNIRLTEIRGLRLPDEPQEGRNRSWAVEEFSATL
ncbi:hypothetical protein CSKR_111171 [Clonorchis sinensis]|uniref:Uncharacterized protein n=1 Tax=Clonorchis sinensis TaxID=79923 RepID=A0A3R7DBA7_CLOSI|nr:hypothetical protein CSKR_111171 [Clonorchis sinensis]